MCILKIALLIGNSQVNRSDVCSEVKLMCSLIITETAWILHSKVLGLLVSLERNLK